MNARVKKARRILAVQEQMHRAEEWKLAKLQQRLQQLEAQQREMIGALNQDNALHGLFIDTMAKYLKALTEQAGEVTRQIEVQLPKTIAEAARLKGAERLLRSVSEQVQRTDDRKELLDIVERYLDRAGTSLP
ncbi:MAG TPA: hypothetical protein VG900_10975 [Hyphomicrobiaceae bacterium]|jgi:hypothetical protein|nr:hypothetical protein [Hyphomicrobiaceae bacterium]